MFEKGGRDQTFNRLLMQMQGLDNPKPGDVGLRLWAVPQFYPRVNSMICYGQVPANRASPDSCRRRRVIWEAFPGVEHTSRETGLISNSGVRGVMW